MKCLRKNIKYFALGGILCAGLAIGGGSALPANAQTVLSEDSASLFLPSSFEQYLELSSPSVAAISKGYIAIADTASSGGDILYLYDREMKAYTRFDFPSGQTVTGLGFAGERLFLSTRSASIFFYEYDFSQNALIKLGINCTTFCTDGDTLYTASIGGQGTTIAAYPVASLREDSEPTPTALVDVQEQYTTPNMTVLDGKLYCAFGSAVYYSSGDGFTLDASDWLTEPSVRIHSVAALSGRLYFAAEEGLYQRGQTKPLLAAKDIKKLFSYGDELYAIQGSSVKRIALSEGGAAFTGYEIASASSSENRLSGAVDSARGGDLLVTADRGNGRVSVYDFATGSFAQITGGDDFSPTHVATDGTIIAAVSQNTVYTCTYREGAEMTFTATDAAPSNEIRGLACVYGEVYFVTGNAYGKVGAEPVFHDSCGAPAALASDVYGELFVVYNDRSVVKFSETAFLDKDAAGDTLGFTLPEGYSSLRADFEGNLYYLLGSALCRNGDETIATVDESDFVYTMSEGSPLAFALGYEDDEVYFLFGEYIVATNGGALDIPTLREIKAGDIGKNIFSTHAGDGLFLNIPAGTVGIRTDLSALREDAPECFPYEFYFRTEEAAQGILLGMQNGYALVTVYEVGENSRAFTTSLFRLSGVEELLLPTDSYWAEADETAYLTSDVSAYFFPCLPAALADQRLSRGTSVHVVATVSAPDLLEYALIEFAKDGEATARGYVPCDYLTSVSPSGGGEESFLFATLKDAPTDEGYLFVAEDGSTLSLHGGERVRLEDLGDGTYTARYSAEDGKIYSLVLGQDMLDFGANDTLRISLIVILCVVAVLIVALYVWFLPRKKKEGRK